jgi:RNA polymerase sigma-70 factor (ECF subfamily)
MESVFTGQLNNGLLGCAPTNAAQTLASAVRPASTTDEDASMVRRSAMGDRTAYSRLVERHERKVMTLVSHVISSVPGSSAQFQSDVEDLTQEVFVLAWKALPSFRGDARFSTWLYRIAVNRALKERKRARFQSAHLASNLAEFTSETGYKSSVEQAGIGDDPAESVCSSVRDAMLWTAVDSLPDKQRVVILLHYFESCSCEEIAKIVDCSVGTVWSRLHYGCLKLKQTLSGEDDCRVF